MKKLINVLIIGMLLLVGCESKEEPKDDEYITYEEYLEIEIGMTYEEVVEIVGGEEQIEMVSSYETIGREHRIEKYQIHSHELDGYGVANIEFKDGLVNEIEQSYLD